MDLSHPQLTDAILNSVDLSLANLTEARVNAAGLIGSRLYRTTLYGAQLRLANLNLAPLIGTFLDQGDMRRCKVYDISAWNIQAESALLQDLQISSDEPGIAIDDDLEIAQFLHVMIDNTITRRMIDSLTSKVVLILGRLTPP